MNTSIIKTIIVSVLLLMLVPSLAYSKDNNDSYSMITKEMKKSPKEIQKEVNQLLKNIQKLEWEYNELPDDIPSPIKERQKGNLCETINTFKGGSII